MADGSLRERSQRTLEAAERHYRSDPTLQNTVWYGRVLGFRNRFDDAIDVFTEGLEQHPDAFELLRQRGHRYISTRRFAEARTDLQRAADLIDGMELWIEPDGLDNELPVPATSIQFNTYYHLGLAHYLLRQWDDAASTYRLCRQWVADDDNDGITACADWLYMTLRRAGHDEEAADVLEDVPHGLGDEQFLEGPSYYRRLRMYRGELTPDDLLNPDRGTQAIHNLDTIYATQGYGVGNWYLYTGDLDSARAVFQRIVEGKGTGAFGYIAAELDLAEMG